MVELRLTCPKQMLCSFVTHGWMRSFMPWSYVLFRTQARTQVHYADTPLCCNTTIWNHLFNFPALFCEISFWEFSQLQLELLFWWNNMTFKIIFMCDWWWYMVASDIARISYSFGLHCSAFWWIEWILGNVLLIGFNVKMFQVSSVDSESWEVNTTVVHHTQLQVIVLINVLSYLKYIIQHKHRPNVHTCRIPGHSIVSWGMDPRK